jgi:hypothetical protein
MQFLNHFKKINKAPSEIITSLQVLNPKSQSALSVVYKRITPIVGYLILPRCRFKILSRNTSKTGKQSDYVVVSRGNKIY